MYLDGGLDAQAFRFEGNSGSRTVGVHGGVQRFAGPDCIGVCIEEPFSGQFSSVKALFPMLGAAVLACKLAGLPWATIHLSKLKILATGKGNAKKSTSATGLPPMRIRWKRSLRGIIIQKPPEGVQRRASFVEQIVECRLRSGFADPVLPIF
ncbi:MAG: hypothetical protein QHD01_27410 [Bradyrhizobium sp.]|uniref:hypothetical protein n=1 Tax=Bradyrhizobium sp. TaxID=376 RepID=UPI0029ADCEE8|nr:hypothetical protein [Bradyrhizobium sp.]MDX3970304.1 hypothetical protein [Bradyrhizobium sp.]